MAGLEERVVREAVLRELGRHPRICLPGEQPVLPLCVRPAEVEMGPGKQRVARRELERQPLESEDGISRLPGLQSPQRLGIKVDRIRKVRRPKAAAAERQEATD